MKDIPRKYESKYRLWIIKWRAEHKMGYMVANRANYISKKKIYKIMSLTEFFQLLTLK